MRGSVGLVVTPSVPVGVSPLRWIEREIVDQLGPQCLVVAPSVPVGILPLRWFCGESIGAVVNGPVFITVGKRVPVRIHTTVPVAKRITTNERTRIGLCGVVNKLPDVPKPAGIVEPRVGPIVAVAIVVGIVPLRGIKGESVAFTCWMSEPRLNTVEASRVGV